MIRLGDGRARVMEVREVRTLAGPARMMIYADLAADGGLVRVGWTLPHSPSEAERAAAALLDKIGGSLRGGHSIHALIQRTEQLLDVLEMLRRVEDAHGERARALLAERAA